MNLKHKKFWIGFKTPSSDYSSFNAFDSGTLCDNRTPPENDVIVGIISPTREILSEIDIFFSETFYKVGRINFCLFTDSGLLLGYKKNPEWVQINGNMNIALEVPKIQETVLSQLIYENLQKIFLLTPKTEERQNAIDSIIKVSCQQLAELIASDKGFLNHIEWRDLERTLGEALSGIGFKVEVTPSSKDAGKDLIVSFEVYNDDHSFIIELKHWRSKKKVGIDPVEKFLRVVLNEKRTGGLFLSSYGYTEDCLEAIASFSRYNLNLGDGNKIFTICKIYKQKKDGLVIVPEDFFYVLASDCLMTPQPTQYS